MFWKYRRGDLVEMKGMKVNRGIVQISDGGFEAAKYDIEHNEREIQIILTYIELNTPP